MNIGEPSLRHDLSASELGIGAMRFITRIIAAATAICLMSAGCASTTPSARQTISVQPIHEDGLIVKKSAYSLDETVWIIKQDVAAKGIMFFADIDQAKLAKGAGIDLPPSHLLLFGNPPLGIQFLTSNPNSGLDWPVRLLVREDAAGDVWVVGTNFDYIAKRHRIEDRDEAFAMANDVLGSIMDSAISH
jgi:uncharacterized protein (DUF302 family)